MDTTQFEQIMAILETIKAELNTMGFLVFFTFLITMCRS